VVAGTARDGAGIVNPPGVPVSGSAPGLGGAKLTIDIEQGRFVFFYLPVGD